MNLPGSRDPFILLRNIERRSRTHGLGLPQQQELVRDWVGVGFRLGPALLLAPVGAVAETLKPPEVTPVPGVKRWVKGIANVRGRLVPIIDVRDSLAAGAVEMNRSARVLVVESSEIFTGLLVDEIFGLRQFGEEEREAATQPHASFIREYLDGGFLCEGSHWGVLNIARLVFSPAVLQAAQ